MDALCSAEAGFAIATDATDALPAEARVRGDGQDGLPLDIGNRLKDWFLDRSYLGWRAAGSGD
jgi:hypothetical protein